MKRMAALFLLLVWVFAAPAGVSAHPADMYRNYIRLTLTPQELHINWEIRFDPMMAPWLWNQADADQNGTVTQAEANAWAAEYAPLLSASLDGRALPLQLEQVQFPAQLTGMQAGTDYITLQLAAPWPGGAQPSHRLALTNRLDQKNSLNWFGIAASGSSAFLLPSQEAYQLTVEIFPDRQQAAAQTNLLTAWDSNTPSLAVTPSSGGSAPPQPAAGPTPQEILLGLVRQQNVSTAFYVFALGVSLALGALHALTPGHGKTVVAAYLVGARGTAKHAVVLGSVVTLTHTGSVFLFGLVTLVASRYILPGSIIPALEVVSGLLIVGLGLYLLVQRLREWQASRAGGHHHHHHPHDHEHDHTHAHDGQEHDHTHDIPDHITWRSLIALGVSGGLVPCPDAIAILLVAIAINRILLGLALIVAFSLGLAAVLIAIGLLMVQSRRLFDRLDAFSRFAPAMPVISAVVVLFLGVALTFGAVSQLGASAFPLAGSSVAAPGRVMYLVPDAGGNKQIFILDTNGQKTQLTNASKSISEFAVSPDFSQAVYFAQDSGLSSEVGLLDLKTKAVRVFGACQRAMCRQPVWAPDGAQVFFEKLNLGGSDPAFNQPTLWRLTPATGKSQAVFQDSQLPVVNARWSPDGQWLSYSAPDELRLFNPSSGESRSIPNQINSAAAWSFDSRSLVFREAATQGQTLVAQFFQYSLVSGAVSPFYADLGQEDILAVWSPTGEWVAAVRRDTTVLSGDQVWLLRPDGSQAQRLTDAPGLLHASLVWSPDGKDLLWDAYALDTSPLETRLQVLDIATGKLTDLGAGINPVWVRQPGS